MNDSISSVQEFIQWVEKLEGQQLLYRGLADADWTVESSAHRRMRGGKMGYPELIKHLSGAIAIMNTVTHHNPNRAWAECMRRIQRWRPKTNTNFDFDLDLPDDESSEG